MYYNSITYLQVQLQDLYQDESFESVDEKQIETTTDRFKQCIKCY